MCLHSSNGFIPCSQPPFFECLLCAYASGFYYACLAMVYMGQFEVMGFSHAVTYRMAQERAWLQRKADVSRTPACKGMI